MIKIWNKSVIIKNSPTTLNPKVKTETSPSLYTNTKYNRVSASERCVLNRSKTVDDLLNVKHFWPKGRFWPGGRRSHQTAEGPGYRPILWLSSKLVNKLSTPTLTGNVECGCGCECTVKTKTLIVSTNYRQYFVWWSCIVREQWQSLGLWPHPPDVAL